MTSTTKLALLAAWIVVWPAVCLLAHYFDARRPNKFHWEMPRLLVCHLGTLALWAVVPFVLQLKF